MALSGTAFTILLKEIYKGFFKKKWAAVQKNHKALSFLQKANISSLENDPKSIYAHALAAYGVDKEPNDLVQLFAQDDVRDAMERNQDQLQQVLESHLHQNKKLPGLKKFASVKSLQAEIEEFQEIFQGFQIKAANPLLLKMFNEMQAGMWTLLKTNEKNSFEYQAEEYLKAQIKSFEKKYLDQNRYIDLDGISKKYTKSLIFETNFIPNHKEDHYEMVTESREELDEGVKQILHQPLDTYINQWLKNASSQLLIIMGEYGTGKTTFTQHLTHQLACQYLDQTYTQAVKDDKKRIPLFLPLRDFEKSMENFISDQCSNNYNMQSMNFAEFKRRIDQDELLVILDGFDEMTQRTDADERKTNFAKINRLIAESPNSKFILTCRKEYFQSTADMQKLFVQEQNEIVYLSPFDEPKIKQFLRAYTEQPEEMWKQIDATFDLKDLAKRPVLLELIVKHLPRLIKQDSHTGEIKASDLYQACIEDELVRVDEKLKQAIPGENRLEILKRLAVWMYVNDTLSFDTRQIAEELQLEQQFKTQSSWEYERKLSEFLTFTFLIREDDYQFRISHKSFRDYLTALIFVEEVNNGRNEYFSKAQVSDEVKAFMLEQQLEKAQLKTLVLTAKNLSPETQWQGTNAANLLLELDSSALANENISECILPMVDFKGCKLEGTSFHSAVLTGAIFSKSILSADSVAQAETIDTSMNIESEDLNSLEGVQNIKGLRGLGCSSNQITDLSPIKNLSNLQFLFCNNNKITDLSPIKNLSNLQFLTCRNNKITDLSPIKSLSNLQALYCNNDQITDLSPIKNLSNLQSLFCQNNQITDLSPIKNLSNLQSLFCQNNQITDLSPIKNLINLETLIIDKDKYPTTMIEDLQKALPNLTIEFR